MNTILQVISDTNIGGGGRSLLNYLSCQDRSQFQSQVVLPRGSALKGPVEALGVPVHEIDAMADRSMDLSAVAPLRRVIRAVDPDLVHTHGSMSARMAARLCGKKVIYTKHCVFPLGRGDGKPGGPSGGPCAGCLPVRRGHRSEPIGAGAAAPSPAYRIGRSTCSSTVWLPWRPLRRRSGPHCRAEYGFGPEDFVVGILARVEEYKGHSVLLDAAEQLLSQGRRVKVLVAGEGRAEAALRLRAVSFPQGTVFFAGFIERVERALWAMDAQINASTESEGTSLSLLEGMSFGLPAVVSDIGGNPLLIQDGENGLVFPNRDSQALAGCVARLMDDPALLRKLGEGAKRSFEENYTGEIFAKHVEDVYRDVLKGVSHGTK